MATAIKAEITSLKINDEVIYPGPSEKLFPVSNPHHGNIVINFWPVKQKYIRKRFKNV